MSTSKTAISLDSSLLEQTDKLAQETGNSRSRIIAIALQKYFHELEQQKILEQLDSVYEDETSSDSEFTAVAKEYFAQNVVNKSEQW